MNTVAVQPRLLNIALIRRDRGTQCRAALCDETIRSYAALMEDGVEFPPVLVFFDDGEYLLVDGFHRVAASLSISCQEIFAEVRPGTRPEAIWRALSCNAKHGKQRTPQDLEFAFKKLLDHPLSRDMGNRGIAKHLGVSEPTIRRLRKTVSASCDADTVRNVERAGRQYKMRVGRIGHSENAASVTILKKLPRNAASLGILQRDLANAKAGAPHELKMILAIIGDWISGLATAHDLAVALENFASERRGRLKTEVNSLC